MALSVQSVALFGVIPTAVQRLESVSCLRLVLVAARPWSSAMAGA
jgi:hypothetical protein